MTRRLTLNRLTENAEEKSSIVIEATFKDSTGATFSPTSIAWTLTDAAGSTTYATGTVTPAATVEIMLQGSALALSSGFEGDSEERRLLVEALYNSGAYSNVPLRDSCIFNVKNLVAVT
jgi:hypothetical protein